LSQIMRVACLAISLALHGLLLLLWPRPHDATRDRDREALPAAASIDVGLVPSRAAGEATRPPVGPPAATVAGPADQIVDDPASPWPRADVDTPDPAPAAHGGGAPGGTLTWTGRSDGESLRAQMWNDPSAYRLGRRRTGDARSAPESISRAPDPGIAAAADPGGRRARDGAEAGAPAGSLDDLDPRWDDGVRPGAPGPGEIATRLAEEGGVRVEPRRPLVVAGDAATHAETRGPTVDDVNAAQASDERRPHEVELTAPRAGGRSDGEGVAGPDDDPGISPRSARTGAGAGGTPADARQRDGGQMSTRARAQDAYFRRLTARVLDRVVYPRDLALSLEQGEVIVSFTLARDGSVTDLRVTRSSGFPAFDRALLLAVRVCAPFDPLPEAVSSGAPSVQVNAPFVFSNPLIR
jgi:TonB family protein